MESIGSRIESARVSIRVSTSRLLRARGTTGADPPSWTCVGSYHEKKADTGSKSLCLHEPESCVETRAGTRSTSDPPATAQTIISPNPYEYDPIRLFR
jgi:hypothetical protein